MSPKTLSVGTRASPLALCQARAFAQAFARAHNIAESAVDITPFTTKGDRLKDKSLGPLGGKGLFTAELSKALQGGEIAAAVHSLKDVPTRLEGSVIGCVLPREQSADALITPKGGACSLEELAPNARIGTASLRRKAICLAVRPELVITLLRGNVETRIGKMLEGEIDATILACAGINRLALSAEKLGVAITPLDEGVFLPAPAQGVLAVECLAENKALRLALAGINCATTQAEVVAERAFLAGLNGSCRTPIAARARGEGDRLILQGRIYSLDGSEQAGGSCEGHLADAEQLGTNLAQAIRTSHPHLVP
ncbi:MAG: hydroxymethylbilane synthase [Parvibaculales bacterium]